MRSRNVLMLVGLAILTIAPTSITSKIVADYETVNQTPTITKEIKSKENIEEVEFISVHQEEIIEEVEESEYIEVSCELTFYTDLAMCNGTNAGKNAIGGSLSSTSIAIPRDSMPFGTKIDLGEYGIRYADDVGSPKYIRIKSNGTYIFDVFIPRIKGESDKQYKDRIMDMGRIETIAKVYYKDGD